MRETASDLVDGHEFQAQRRPSMASSSVKSMVWFVGLVMGFRWKKRRKGENLALSSRGSQGKGEILNRFQLLFKVELKLHKRSGPAEPDERFDLNI